MLAFLLCAETAAGQGVTRAADDTYVTVAVRIFEKPEIDGVLDEPFWQTIPAISDFRQRLPSEGTEPSERTEVRTQRFLSDLEHLRPGSVTSAGLVKLTYLVAF